MSDSLYTAVPWDQLIPPPTEVNNTHRDYLVFGIVIALGVLATSVVTTRLVYKYSVRKFAMEDHAIFFALMLYLGWTAMAGYMILESGIDKPIGQITYGEFIVFYKGVFISQWMYPLMSASIRAAIIFFYRSIFALASRFYSVSLWVLLALQALYVVAFTVLPGFECTPISDGWEPLKRMTSCSDLYVTSSLGLYGSSLAFDVILLVFPIYATSCLKMCIKKRLGVILIFGLGASASVVAGYKLASFYIAVNTWTPTAPDWWNYQAAAYIPPQYNQYGKMFWIPTQVEPTVALIGASLPAFLQAYNAVSLKLSQIRSKRSAGSSDPDSPYNGSNPSQHRVYWDPEAKSSGSSSQQRELEFLSTPEHDVSLKAERMV
ncbi:hypothetical protein V8F06_008672 [Rhypophila decipiens]